MDVRTLSLGRLWRQDGCQLPSVCLLSSGSQAGAGSTWTWGELLVVGEWALWSAKRVKISGPPALASPNVGPPSCRGGEGKQGRKGREGRFKIPFCSSDLCKTGYQRRAASCAMGWARVVGGVRWWVVPGRWSSSVCRCVSVSGPRNPTNRTTSWPTLGFSAKVIVSTEVSGLGGVQLAPPR